MNPALTVIAAAPADEPNTGWGKVLALLVAAGLFWAATEAHKRWKALQETPSGSPSRAAAAVGANGAKPQIMAGSGTDVQPARRPAGKEAAVAAFVAEHGARKKTTDLVREAHKRFGASRRTVMRAIRQARQSNTTDNAE